MAASVRRGDGRSDGRRLERMEKKERVTGSQARPPFHGSPVIFSREAIRFELPDSRANRSETFLPSAVVIQTCIRLGQPLREGENRHELIQSEKRQFHEWKKKQPPCARNSDHLQT